MSKVLIVNGSPKGQASNSLKIAKAFTSGVDPADLEVIDLADKQIGHCRGCFCCWNKTPGVCAIPDDAAEVTQKILDCDCLIWSLPLYSFGMPSLAKAALDRMIPSSLPYMTKDCKHPHRDKRKSQKVVLISTAGFCRREGNFDALVRQFDILYGKYTSILCPEGELFSIPPLVRRTDQYLGYAKEAGKEFFSGDEISAATKSKLNELLFPEDRFVRMANASWSLNDEGVPVKVSPARMFLSQMCALYNPEAIQKDSVLEFYFTDSNERFQLKLSRECVFLHEGFEKSDVCVETDFETWSAISNGRCDPMEAARSGRLRVSGDASILGRLQYIFSV